METSASIDRFWLSLEIPFFTTVILNKNDLYKSVSQKSKDLAQAQQTIEEYLKQGQNEPQKKKKRNDLE